MIVRAIVLIGLASCTQTVPTTEPPAIEPATQGEKPTAQEGNAASGKSNNQAAEIKTVFELTSSQSTVIKSSATDKDCLFRIPANTTLSVSALLGYKPTSHHVKISIAKSSQPLLPCRKDSLPTSPQIGYVYTGHFKSPEKIISKFYDSNVGKKLAEGIRTFVADGIKCGGNVSFAKCMTCVGRLLGVVKNSDAKPIWPAGVFEELNTSNYARSFAVYFKPKTHAEPMKLMPVKGFLKPVDAPDGTIVVIDKCSSNPAGDIYIVSTRNGVKEACADFCRPVKTACGGPQATVIGMYMPYRQL